MGPSKEEVRWLLFGDDELKELHAGLMKLQEEDLDTTESEMLRLEAEEALKMREHGDREGYNVYIRKGC